MQLHALDLRKGAVVLHQGRMCTVTSWNILRNDRRAFVQMTLRDLLTGRVTELKEHGETKYDVLETDLVDLQHSYRDGGEEVFYAESGEEYRCPAGAVEAELRWSPDVYKGLLVDGRLVSIGLPSSVVATIAETAPPMKGASGLKDALLDNGVKVRVGVGLAPGDRVRVDPETLEYKERA